MCINKKNDWIAEQYAWKQLAILCHFVLHDDTIQYSKIEIKSDTYLHQFLYT